MSGAVGNRVMKGDLHPGKDQSSQHKDKGGAEGGRSGVRNASQQGGTDLGGYKSINFLIHNVNELLGSDRFKKGEEIRSLVSKLREQCSVDITSSINLSTATLSVVISGLDKNVEKAREHLVRKTSPTITRYIFVDPALVSPIMRKRQPGGVEASVTVHANGDPEGAFTFYKSGRMKDASLLYEGEDPAFSVPKSLYEAKPLLVIRGIQGEVEAKWKQIQDLAQECIPNKYVSVQVDRSSILLVSLDGTPNQFLPLISSSDTMLIFNKTQISVTLPPIFPATEDHSSQVVMYGPGQIIDLAVDSLNKSLASIAESTVSVNVPLDKKYHRILSGANCANVPYIIISTGCAISFPPYTSDANYVTIRAQSMNDVESAKHSIHRIVQSSGGFLYDLNLASLNFNISPAFLENILSYLKCSESRKIDEFEGKYGCKLVKLVPSLTDTYWLNLLSVECTDPKVGPRAVSELSELIKTCVGSLSSIEMVIPYSLISPLHQAPTVAHFIPSESIFARKSPLLGVLCLPRHFSSTTCSYRSKNYFQEVCLIFRGLSPVNSTSNGRSSSKNKHPSALSLDDFEVLPIVTQLFNALKSISNMHISFYPVPPSINAKFYPKIVNSSIIPLFEKLSVPYSFECSAMDNVTMDFAEEGCQYIKKEPFGNAVVFCAPKGYISGIHRSLDEIFSAWAEAVSKRSVVNIIQIPSGATYHQILATPRKKDVEMEDVMALAYERLGIDLISDDILKSTKIECLHHNLSVRLTRPPVTQNGSPPQSDSRSITISGLEKVVSVVSDIIMERMELHGDKTQARISVIPKLSDASRQILDSHSKKIALMNRIIFGSSGPVRALLQEARGDGRLKIGFVKSNELVNDNKVDKLPNDAYILWASGSCSEIDSVVQKIIAAMNDELSRCYTISFTANKFPSSQAMSLFSQEINEIKKKHKVSITITESQLKDADVGSISITIVGIKKVAEAVKASCMKLLSEYATFVDKKVYIPWYMHTILLGHNKEKIKSIASNLGGQKNIFISAPQDLRSHRVHQKSYFYPDTITVSSFENVFSKVLDSLVSAVSKGNATLSKLINLCASIEDPQNLETSSSGVFSSTITLPSGLNRDRHSTLSATVKSHALSLNNVIIRSVILPTDNHDNLEFEGYDELNEYLSKPESAGSAKDLLRLFMPAIRYTIIANKKEHLKETEKFLRSQSLMHSCYKLNEDERQMLLKYDSNSSGLTPALDIFTQLIRKLENFLHLDFKVIFSQDKCPLKLIFCTLLGWKGKLTSALTEIFKQIKTLDHIRGVIIQVSESEAVDGDTGAAAYNVETISNKLKRRVEDYANANNIHVFDMCNYPPEFEHKFVKLYIGGSSTNAIDNAVQVIMNECAQETGFQYCPDNEVSHISNNLTLSRISATGRLAGAGAYPRGPIGDATPSSEAGAPAASQPINYETLHGVAVNLLPFTSNMPWVSDIPKVTGSTTPVIDVGISAAARSGKPHTATRSDVKYETEVLNEDGKGGAQAQIPADAKDMVFIPSGARLNKSPSGEGNPQAPAAHKSPPPQHPARSTTKVPQPQAEPLAHSTPDDSGSFILKEPKRRVKLVYKSVPPTVRQPAVEEEYVAPPMDMPTDGAPYGKTFVAPVSNIPPSSGLEVQFGQESEESFDDTDGINGYQDVEHDKDINEEVDSCQDYDAEAESIREESVCEYGVNDECSDELENYMSPKSSLSSLSYASVRSSLSCNKPTPESRRNWVSDAPKRPSDSTNKPVNDVYYSHTTDVAPSRPPRIERPASASGPAHAPISEWKEVKKRAVGAVKKSPAPLKPKPTITPSKLGDQLRHSPALATSDDNAYFLTTEDTEKVGSDAPIQPGSAEKKKKRRKKKKTPAAVSD